MMSNVYYFKLLVILMSTLITLCHSCPGNFTSISFDQAFHNHWGELSFTRNEINSIDLYLRNNTGSSGFASRGSYSSGLFSANIKLPPQNYSAGIVVTYYLSNGDKYYSDEHHDQHDEIDFEFLGHKDGNEWILQTNFFGNGSVLRGREERYKLWFDPSTETHKYSIFWDEKRILFYVDDTLIRESKNVDKMGGDYPSKPMSLYATIWDGSGWATDDGKAKANFTFQPFVAQYSDFFLTGCRYNPINNVSYCRGSEHWSVCGGNVTSGQMGEYEEFRKKYLIYSYCDDKKRYNVTMPECLVEPKIVAEAEVKEEPNFGTFSERFKNIFPKKNISKNRMTHTLRP